MSYESVILAKRPKADIIVGETFKIVSKPLPDPEDLKDGELLIEVLYLSLDPAMRGWLNGMQSLLLKNHSRAGSLNWHFISLCA